MNNVKIMTHRLTINTMFIQMVLVSVIWGGTFIAGRILQPEIPPLLSATVRFIFAAISLVLLLTVTRLGWKKVTLNQFLQIMVLGVSGVFIYQVLFFYGLQIIPASRAALLVAINPAMIALIAFLLWREKITLTKGVGIAFCVIGAVVLLSNKAAEADGFLTNKGDLAILGCVISWGIYTVAGKRVIREIGALHTVTYAILLGTFLLVVASLFTQTLTLDNFALFSFYDLLSLAYLGILGSAIAYVWYYQGVDQLGAASAGSFIALNPLTAVLIGSLFLDENINTIVFAGGAMVILGILITNRKNKA
ncbi:MULTISPECIES: DMT family transporter [Providencia]|uniref:Drug/metabolite transporter (DMT) superfamily permease n=1 Tax=Providencia heimbachae ATCC 35613 TaxID=1354272 RepID=A0A1B7K386_9GAMM|nr:MULTISPECIES: EamA family transporter [Providencia]MBP6121354.1 EamA family transporter [Providencia sp.]NIH22757.1 EamA family transporter [Providencia heimbachae]OAT54600.1 drug/metabolite transporter (DMT) superfamily permease [Providencia heimbachae ATCC 35613]SQH13352.1 Uncharacterized inner membrane transporter yedA [Providencia heimbachae]